MSLQTDNVIPNNHGRIFGTDADTDEKMQKIHEVISAIEGVKDVILNNEIFPREFTVHTTNLVKIGEVQEAVKTVGQHAIPKGLFPLTTYTESGE